MTKQTLPQIENIINERIKNVRLSDYPGCCTETVIVELECLIDEIKEAHEND